jgi:hypothetical protein
MALAIIGRMFAPVPILEVEGRWEDLAGRADLAGQHVRVTVLGQPPDAELREVAVRFLAGVEQLEPDCQSPGVQPRSAEYVAQLALKYRRQGLDL